MRKLYYAPGIISLIGLIFLLPYSYKRIAPTKEGTIKFNVPKQGGDPYQFSEEWILKTINKKKKINFTLNEDSKTNQKKLDIARYEARKLKYTFDTTTVIIISFTPETPYSEFIKIVDFCRADSIRRYATVRNDFIIFGEAPSIKAEIKYVNSDFVCGMIIIPPPKKSFKKRFLMAMKRHSNFQTLSLSISWMILVSTHLYFQRKKMKVSDYSSTP